MTTVRNAGFAVIELMVVIAIIGILSAISVVSYQSHAGKAQAVEALSLSSGLRAGIETALAHGDNPADLVDEHAPVTGKYVEQILVDEHGNISARFGAGVLDGMELTLSREDDSPSWTCSGLPNRYLPTGCRAWGNAGGVIVDKDGP